MENEKKNLNKEEIKQIHKKPNKTVLITVGVVTAIILIIIGISSMVSNINEKKKQEREENNKVVVPKLIGMTYKEAKEEIEKLGLQIDAKLGNLEDDNIITTQDPYADKRIEKGETVTVYLEIPPTVKSDNYYGMRFRKTISDFCKEYNTSMENIYKQLRESTTAIDIDKITENEFVSTNTFQNNLKQYYCNKIGYTICLFVEPDNNYIVFANVGFNKNKVANYNKMQTFVIQKIYPSMVMALTGKGYSKTIGSMEKYIEKAEKENINALFEDNVVYNFQNVNTNENQLFYIYAMSEEKYNEIINGSQDTSSPTSNSERVNELKQMIEYLNNNYYLGFEPTEEQMTTILEYESENGNFDNDSLMEYILNKGWVSVRGGGTIDNSSSGSSSSGTTSSSSGNKNNSSTNNSDDDNMEIYIKGTLKINIKDLIKKSSDPEVQKIIKSNTINVSIYVEESHERSEFIMYHGGFNSIPDIITKDFTFTTTGKNKSVKSNVKIVIDNTATEIKESTLYEKELTFESGSQHLI